jgi:putative transposase
LLRSGIQKPHWQEGFFDHVLRNSESYAQKWDYVRLNPVRAELCAEPGDWAFQGEIVSIRF